MTEDEILKALAENADRRDKIAASLSETEDDERELIATAWRAKVSPPRIAAATRRSDAFVRKLRPDDVPPLRLGGGASSKPKRRPRKS